MMSFPTFHPGRSVSLVFLLGCAWLFSGCAVRPQPLETTELQQQLQGDRAAMFAQNDQPDHPLTLPEAIARAMRFNLEQRVKALEELQAKKQISVSSLDMFPKLLASGGYTNRSNEGASTSNSSLVPSSSLDRDRNTADLTFSWNILDLGVSYFNARQEANRFLIARERQRKIVRQLVQEVRGKFWRAAAAEELRQDIQETLTRAENALQNARQSEQEAVRNPMEALQYQQNLFDQISQLEGIAQELETARVELASIINLPPGAPLTLELPKDGQIRTPSWSMPMERMEETALLLNADLRESVLQTRIAVTETYKAVAKLLPGVSFNLGSQYDSNSYLVEHAWQEASARVSFNIFNLLTGPSQISLAHSGLDVANARRLAVRMAVLTQLHLANHQFAFAKHNFRRLTMRHDVSQRISQQTANRQQQDAGSILELVVAQTREIVDRARTYLALAEMHNALGRLQATLGLDMDPGEPSTMDLPALTAKIASSLELMSTGEGGAQAKP
ncbi:MAG: TolC family protein [Magnetococcales bacterium]|nr:TolC family protein [Magnetococcales bacterium]